MLLSKVAYNIAAPPHAESEYFMSNHAQGVFCAVHGLRELGNT